MNKEAQVGLGIILILIGLILIGLGLIGSATS